MLDRVAVTQMRAACRLELRGLVQEHSAVPVQPGPHGEGLSTEALARRMRALPDRYLHVLLLRFGCGLTHRETDEALEITHASGIESFALQLLAHGLDRSAPPPAELLKAAANHILRDVPPADKLQPSWRCRRAIRTILRGGTLTAPAGRLPLRTLVAAAVIAALLLALSAAAVAALIRNHFNWSITPTGEGVEITATDILLEPTAEDYEELRRYRPAQLPAGFSYAYTDDHESGYLTDYYHSEEGQRIILWKALAGPSVAFGVMNEELDSFRQWELDGTTYLYYEHSRHGRGVVYWELDGYAFMLVTPLDAEEALAIAQSVAK